MCAGDVLDHWDQPPWFINWLIDHVPKMFAIPGQHDLPHHRYADVRRSAYWTLCRTKTIINLDPADGPAEIAYGLFLHPFPWGFPVAPCPRPADGAVNVAVVHAYVWAGGPTGYAPDAPADKLVRGYAEKLRGYNAAVFGDNHKPFLCPDTPGTAPCPVVNHGTFVRRHADERVLVTGPVLMYLNGGAVELERADWDTAEDRWVSADALRDLETAGADAEALVALLTKTDEQARSFRAAVRAAAADESLSPGCRRLLSAWADREPT